LPAYGLFALSSPKTESHRFLRYASAYVGGYISVYNDKWGNYPSVQVHEVGHNLRLKHAGELKEYDDQVGFMGSGFEQDTTNMCYGLSAAWELGWYGRRRRSINFSSEPGFRGHLIGIVDYENPGASGKFVTVRAQSSTVAYEVYMGFNLARGFNSDTKDGSNLVTITVQEDEGDSRLMTSLSTGSSYRISNFQGNLGLNIKVHSISLDAVPPFADVEIYIDGCPAGSTSSSCNACASNNDCRRGNSCVTGTCNAGTCSFNTSTCPGNFELNLRTDSTGNQTAWQLINTCSGSVVRQSVPYGNNAQITLSQEIGQSPHKFV